MDARGARFLAARILCGAKPGDRVEVLSAGRGNAALTPGDRGIVTGIGEGEVLVRWDRGPTSAVDVFDAQLRVCRTIL